MQAGKIYKFEGQKFAIGLPPDGKDKEDASFWADVFKHVFKASPGITIHNQRIWTICRNLYINAIYYGKGRGSPASYSGAKREDKRDEAGFRPVLYPLLPDGRPDPLLLDGIPNGTVLRAYSMWVDGVPVRTDGETPEIFAPSTRIDSSGMPIDDSGHICFSDAPVGNEYLIPWVVVDGYAISEKVLLTNISWDKLHQEGFC